MVKIPWLHKYFSVQVNPHKNSPLKVRTGETESLSAIKCLNIKQAK